jgi:hypothetical protein
MQFVSCVGEQCGVAVSLSPSDMRRDVHRSILAATRGPRTALVRYLTRITHVMYESDWCWCLESACAILLVSQNVGDVVNRS